MLYIGDDMQLPSYIGIMFLEDQTTHNLGGSWAVNLPTAWPQDLHFYGGTEHVAVPRSPTCGSPRWLDDSPVVWNCEISHSNEVIIFINEAQRRIQTTRPGSSFECFQSFTTKNKSGRWTPVLTIIFSSMINPLHKEMLEIFGEFHGIPKQGGSKPIIKFES